LSGTPQLTGRFLDAVALAQELQGGERRSGTGMPFLSHLLVVTGLVIEDGGDEDEAIAALLHDAVEGGGGRPLLKRIERDFGARVARIVELLSDTLDGRSELSWVELKARYLEQLDACEDEGTLRVALSDKLHNARSIVRDYRYEGHAIWERFTEKNAQQQLWYSTQLVELFGRKRPGALAADLRNAVDELAALIAADQEETDEPYLPDQPRGSGR
jgi:(p)ppGpp synthase/HD superfamily hydrolase